MHHELRRNKHAQIFFIQIINDVIDDEMNFLSYPMILLPMITKFVWTLKCAENHFISSK